MQCGGIFPSNRMKKGISRRGTSRGKRSGREESDALEKLDMEQEEQVLISAGRRHTSSERRERSRRGVRQYGVVGTMANWKVLGGSRGTRTPLWAIAAVKDWRPNVARSSRFSRDASNLGFYVKSLDFETWGQHWGSQTKYTCHLQPLVSTLAAGWVVVPAGV